MNHRIVITGAPGSGKTEVIELLKKEPQFNNFIFFEELARKLLTEDSTYRDRWSEFHREIYKRTVERENRLENRSFISDRGTVDAFAFHPETAKDVGTSLELEYKRYSDVILLESSANLGENYYNQDEIRDESMDDVLKIEQFTINVWSEHPRFRFIKAEKIFENKYQKVLKTLLKLLNIKN